MKSWRITLRVLGSLWKPILSAMLVVALASTASAGFVININAGSGLSGNAAALAAFDRAAQQYESIFFDDITVTIDADFLNFNDVNVIGSTSSVTLSTDFDTIRNAIVADGVVDGDGIVAFLPTAGQFSAFVPQGFVISGAMAATKANLKALGFAGLDDPVSAGGFGLTDATINFNTQFSFDFDNSDGVGAAMVDFETVAAHEIGHALGFVPWSTPSTS